MRERVLVAMSGGVDSSLAALLMQQQGFEVVGVTLLLQPAKKPDPELAEVCSLLGIEHHFQNAVQQFHDRVLVPAAMEYDCGRTPNPCCECNEKLKFRELFRAADELKCSRIVTGHYARLECRDGIIRLRRGADAAKDQSYFLYRLQPQELQRILFPLGDMSKQEVRCRAAENALPCASRPDSQDVCFQEPGVCCGETLRLAAGLPERPGVFLYRGKIIGHHSGIHRFTLGQRNGHGVALGVPAYIRSIDGVSRSVELTTEPDELLSASFTLTRLNWQYPVPPEGELQIRVRYRSVAVPCHYRCNGDSCQVTLQRPLRAVTPGQAGVFYDGEYLAGGGVIGEVFPCC